MTPITKRWLGSRRLKKKTANWLSIASFEGSKGHLSYMNTSLVRSFSFRSDLGMVEHHQRKVLDQKNCKGREKVTFDY